MFTASFWKAASERAVATFAQALIAVLSVGATGLLDVDWPGALSAAALAALLSVLKSVASSQVGNEGPSLANEVTTPPAPAIPADDRGESGLTLVLVVLAIILVVVLLVRVV